MKLNITNRIAIIGLATVVLFGSCDNLLDIEADGTISGDVLNNTENIEQALVGAYYSLAGYADGSEGGELLGGDFVLIAELLSHQNGTELRWDSFLGGATYADFMDKDILLTNIRVESNWRRAYEVINLVNNILANIENVESTTDRARIEGEARAIRGMLYFEMARLWGPQFGEANTTEILPVLTDPITDISQIQTPTLSTVSQVYTQAENDLMAAATSLMPFGKNSTRIDYYACQGYLCRIAMQKSDFGTAETHADNIISSNEFTMTSHLDAFNNSENSTQDIFAIQQTLSNNSGDRTTGTGLPAFYSSLPESGLGAIAVFSTLLNSAFLENSPSFAASDTRGTVDATVTESTTSDQLSTAFYTNLANPLFLSPSKFQRADRVIPIIRLAEMHLSRAEAIFESNTAIIDPIALADLNAVRSNAGINTLVAGDFASSLAFYDSLVLERKREFMFEGHLLHDLKRWRSNLDDSSIIIGGFGGSKNPLDNDLILPLPQTETDTWTD
ncbi:MAG: RagB/SusD family nutrient uptake outer membrane protein [Cyclobacteriaceae bacterium]|nr:RagB/SusD family nutrient uptake outer membrane protein [Cyclobacteriaceae bacterium HetDA_MAG_MS6]